MRYFGTLPSPRHWLLFSSLDAALLEDAQGLTATLGLLTELNTIGTPVIFNSNKTPRELTRIADGLCLSWPRIAEYGSIITYPRELRTTCLGLDYGEICSILDKLRSQHAYHFQGIHDWSNEETALHTGLSLELAQAIRHRQGSELLLWEDSPKKLELFREQLQTSGLELQQEERFWRVKAQTGKQQAMQYLIDEYADQWGYRPYAIAISAQADEQRMLLAADLAVIVHNDANPGFDLPTDSAFTPQILRITTSGAAGWRAAISQLLQATRTGMQPPAQGINKRSR